QPVPTIISDGKRFTPVEVRSVMEKLKRKDLSAENLARHMALEQAICGCPLVAGNKVTLLIDRPAAYLAMFQAIRGAKNNINIEIFTLLADKAGCGLARLLMQKAADGVCVNLIYDSYGSICTPQSFFDRLRQSGVHVLAFNPITPLGVLPFRGRWSPIHRDHRKLVIVDGSVAFVGSANIAGTYARTAGPIIGTEGKKLPWLDTEVQIEGPAVAQFQKLFLKTWLSELGQKATKANYFPVLKPQGNELVRAIGNTWGGKNRDDYFAFLAAIDSARDFIDITSAYFVPDGQTVQALTNASRRGVVVTIVLPHGSDSRLALYGGRNYYTQLLDSGVKLYECRGAIVHSKTAVIDGVWVTVGSMNLDLWSILRNNELNAVIVSPRFAKAMEALFRNELDNSEEITLQGWEKRSPMERLLELLTSPLVYWL
ncbi:MAG: phospholipase D-like domain-containing protein, partial [Syntrophobacteraceae bacterium]